MGSLAGLLKRAGHHITGSDTAFYPPMGDALVRWGIDTMQGFDPSHLTPRPDLVVVGNVCRSSNVEARAAIDGGIPYTSLPKAIAQFCLEGRRSLVVAGTHGKTTTTALCAELLERVGLQPGFLIGGIPLGFSESFRLAEPSAPFVIEGDEYDSAFFEKTPKFWHYLPEYAILQAIEYDHADIYPDMDAYRAAFEGFVSRLPEHGVLVANAGDPEVRAVAKHARCKVSYYGLFGEDTGDISPEWSFAPAPVQDGLLPFDLFLGGTSCGRFYSPLFGAYNLRNAVAALALCALSTGASLTQLAPALPQFAGVKRRQELRGVADGVRIYDDFAHHPTAVHETLLGFRARHPDAVLYAVFEPRSATASLRIHQEAYARAFGPADVVLLAPVGRSEIPESKRLDLARLRDELNAAGKRVVLGDSIDALVEVIARTAPAGSAVVAMSNGAFGHIHDKLLCALSTRASLQAPAEPSALDPLG